MTTPILNRASITLEQARAALQRFVPANAKPDAPVFGDYTEYDVQRVIVPDYHERCASVGVDFGVALAQCWVETAERIPGDPRGYVPFSSWWAARPRRNSAGIGVNGRTLPIERDGRGMAIMPASGEWALDTVGQMWRAGCSFESWKDESIPAHIGRLLAYTLPLGAGTDAQRKLISFALSFRPLPDRVRGSAPTVRELGRVYNPSGSGWASPGLMYGAKIEEVIRRIRGI